jgi:uncharacterized protein (TIGR01777 family)
MRIVLAGASGLIGEALKAELRSHGHQVDVLVRHDTGSQPPAPGTDSWDPSTDRVDPNFLAGADAVVCLSGVGVGDHRWTDSYKKKIVASRVDSVGTLARSLAQYEGPRTFIVASAVGYYGDTGDEVVREDHPPGDSFLSSVCRQWEAAADPAREAGVRVVHLRTGLVLSADAALVKRLKPIALLGAAGKLGSGQQYWPWISLADQVAATRFLIEHDVAGPVNVTGPAPVRNAEFMAVLGRILHRPTVLPTPGFAIRAVLGQFAEDVLTGQNAIPAVLTEAGFEFQHQDVESALRWTLDR